MDMSLLRHRFADKGYQTQQFSYHSVSVSPEQVADELQKFLTQASASTLHFVCHSLGGLVVRHLFDHYPEQSPGRVVTLGTPHQPSYTAKRLSSLHAGQRIMGHSIDHGLLGEVPEWHNGHDLGVIAGTSRMGLGLLVPGIPKPNDGTVTVEETRLDGMKGHIQLPVSHFGMLLSEKVFRQSAHFIDHGKFIH